MKFKVTYFFVFANEVVEKVNGIFCFVFQKVVNGKIAARMRLILVKEFMSTFWASPHNLVRWLFVREIVVLLTLLPITIFYSFLLIASQLCRGILLVLF